MLIFPQIDPVAFHIGPLAIRWYALAYLAGFILGWQYAAFWSKRNSFRPNPEDFERFMTWVVFGVILGGRLGYVLFYQAGHYFSHPLEIVQIWHGGMSFHGGCIGAICAIFGYAAYHKINGWALADLAAAATPIGLFFGRLANFVNGELFGRVTDSPLGMVFPYGGPLPRHPSQFYEAILEGLVLFLLLLFFVRQQKYRNRHGFLSGLFLCGYAVARITCEFFREPDAYLGFIGSFTMGQLLCIPMFIAGVIIIARSKPAPTQIHV